MNADEKLAAVAADVEHELHDAVFDPAGWERMITLLGNWMPEVRPLLHVESLSPAKVELARYVGWDPDILAAYTEHYVDQNVFRPAIARTGFHEIGLSSKFLSDEEVTRTAFYTDILAKSGDIRSASGFTLARNTERFAVIGFHYPYARRDEILPLGLKLQSLIAPLAQKAFSLAMRAAARDNARAANVAIDNLAIPAMVLDEDGRVVRANDLGAPLLSGEGSVRVTAKGHLEGGSPQDNARLRASFIRMRTERRLTTCAYRAPTGQPMVAHFVPMRRTEASDPFIAGFVGSIEPAAIVYFLDQPG